MDNQNQSISFGEEVELSAKDKVVNFLKNNFIAIGIVVLILIVVGLYVGGIIKLPKKKNNTPVSGTSEEEENSLENNNEVEEENENLADQIEHELSTAGS